MPFSKTAAARSRVDRSAPMPHSMRMKRSKLICLAGVLFLASTSFAQQQSGRPINVVVADLEQDVRILQRELAAMKIEMEVLLRENRDLRRQLEEAQKPPADYVSKSELDSRLSEMRRAVNETATRHRTEIINLVSSEIEGLASQTQSAINALARSVEGRPRVDQTVTFSDNYPRTGTTHTVRRGDTLSGIARRYDSRVDWIRNANRIAGDTIIAGQELFIPQEPN